MKKAVIAGLSLIMGLTLCTGIAYGDSFKTVKVTNDFANIRESASTDSKLLGKALKEQKLTVVGESGGWYAVHTGVSSTGYVRKEYCASLSEYITGHAGTDGANLRDKPSTNGTVIIKFAPGTPIQVHTLANGWAQVSAQGKNGYIRSDMLNLGFKYQAVVKSPVVKQQAQVAAAPKALVEKQHVPVRVNRGECVAALMEYARSQKGKPYSYGSVGPNAFDCSGFTMYCYKKSLGINLPHSSGSMSQLGTSVSTSEMLPGDLVFFATGGGGRVSHVGIYAGNGQFIHAETSGSVVVSSLREPYYNKRFVCAKRIDMK